MLIADATPAAAEHHLHSYFNVCPESPNSQWVLYFASTDRDASVGEVRISNRQTGEERTLARDVHTEDAHRVACQQWVDLGRKVIFHDERDGQWMVVVVDIETGEETVLAEDRLVGWGQPDSPLVPIYGPHWNPGEHRDLEIVNVETGEITTALTVAQVEQDNAAFLEKYLPEEPRSIFFPTLSPDGTRVFFKLAAVKSGEVRNSSASIRKGLFCYDLTTGKQVFMRGSWGHPSWHPDSRHIVEKGNKLLDTDTDESEQIPGLPDFGYGHPSMNPEGTLYITDASMDHFDGSKKDWGIFFCDAKGHDYLCIDTFDNTTRAKSWRAPHPHPAISADGQRIYYNRPVDGWTRLYVAEIAE